MATPLSVVSRAVVSFRAEGEESRPSNGRDPSPSAQDDTGTSRSAAAPPSYWPRAKRFLKQADPVLARIIARHPRGYLVSRGAPFVTLARAIVGQQISVKAANAVWARVLLTCPDFCPTALLRKRATTLRGCGLSERKVEYLRDLALHFEHEIDLPMLQRSTDDEVIERLTAVRGIGRWTAEMFLIFNLLRPDVLPLDDLGLLKAISFNYMDGEPIEQLNTRAGRARIAQLARNWAPWRSVATWYLWRSLESLPVATDGNRA